MTLEQLFDAVVQARQGDTTLGEQLYNGMQQLAADPNQPDGLRTLIRVLTRILIGERNPDLSQLSDEFRQAVEALLRRLA